MDLDALLGEIRACRACAHELPHAPRPVVRVDSATRILICGQAPGRRVHESGLPFDDPSGDRLRAWMGIDRTTFYDHGAVGVAAMAFCYPGTAPGGGDYPPPPRCAALWRKQLLEALTGVRLTLLVSGYAQAWALGAAHRSMTETVADRRLWPADTICLPHPSWRTTAWERKNPWFGETILPELKARVSDLL